jgi:hypothetical protein
MKRRPRAITGGAKILVFMLKSARRCARMSRMKQFKDRGTFFFFLFLFGLTFFI